MSGQEMLSQKCIEINRLCVTEVIQACIRCNVTKLIYTSTYNVVFGGQEIVNGDENMQTFPISKHTDFYSASKCIAENIILDANNAKLEKGGFLTTCCLRPAAIYGNDEKRHFPRIIKYMDSGLFIFRIGNATVDWIHIDNLTEAYICAAKTLLSTNAQTKSNIGGQTYFVSDGSPISNFEFLRPLCEARGCSYPSLILPTQLMIYLAYVMEKLYIFTKYLNLKIGAYELVLIPFLIRAEVYKVGITHYFSIKKAERDLGYKPLFNSQKGAIMVANYYTQPTLLTNNDFFQFSPFFIYFAIVASMSGLFVSGYDLVSFLPVWLQPFQKFYQMLDTFNITVIPSRYIIMIIFWSANLIHLFEAIYCYYLSIRMGCHNTKWLWVIQTLFLGYGSIMVLNQRQSFLNKISKSN